MPQLHLHCPENGASLLLKTLSSPRVQDFTLFGALPNIAKLCCVFLPRYFEGAVHPQIGNNLDLHGMASGVRFPFISHNFCDKLPGGGQVRQLRSMVYLKNQFQETLL